MNDDSVFVRLLWFGGRRVESRQSLSRLIASVLVLVYIHERFFIISVGANSSDWTDFFFQLLVSIWRQVK
jgi:hypothetical protein